MGMCNGGKNVQGVETYFSLPCGPAISHLVASRILGMPQIHRLQITASSPLKLGEGELQASIFVQTLLKINLRMHSRVHLQKW